MEAKDYLSYFDTHYKEKLASIIHLGVRLDREKGFRKIFAELLAKKNSDFTIIETGCQRHEDDWGAGQSSFLFFEFLEFFGGTLISIDINRKRLNTCKEILAAKFPRPQRAQFFPVLGDSVLELAKLDRPADLLYLDSMDLDRENPAPSMVHHLKEMVSAGKIIAKSPDLLLAVDDNVEDFGKGKYVLEWARATEQPILHNGYQILLRLNSTHKEDGFFRRIFS